VVLIKQVLFQGAWDPLRLKNNDDKTRSEKVTSRRKPVYQNVNYRGGPSPKPRGIPRIKWLTKSLGLSSSAEGRIGPDRSPHTAPF